tara:strand:- start:139 stop:771 length:633 start_codon:yes stop_codon:yes gene_type:complete
MEKEEINKEDEIIKEDVGNATGELDNKTDNAEIKKEITLEEKVKDLEDKIARTLAEMENQRRRYEKEKEDAFEYGGFNFAKEALNLIDNLERAKVSIENDHNIKDKNSLKKILEHLNIIYKDTISIFNKNNIEQIETINKKMDPNLHQTMMELEDDNKEPGTIVQEIQKGYLMKDRLLRPSLVGVSKKKSKIDKKDEKDSENQEKSIENK